MTTAMERPVTMIRILGSPSLARDLTGVLLEVGVSLPNGAAAPAAGRALLVVLVDPTPSDWDAARAEGAPVVLVTERLLDAAEVAEAVLCGADAVVHADSNPERMLEAVNIVMAGGAMLDPHQALALAVAARTKGGTNGGQVVLTRRERQILASIERGDAVKHTALALGISVKTVESQQSRLFCKLGAHNRAQAVARAHALGLLIETKNPADNRRMTLR